MMERKIKSHIVGVGAFLPEKILTNLDLQSIVDTSDEWIFDRTGIKKRHIAADGQFTSDLALEASIAALNSCGMSAEELDLIIIATTTPDLTFPSTATILQAKLGAKNAVAFDVQAVCSGFVFALSIADNFIRSGQAKKALVIGAETLSRIVDWSDRNSCVLFGDGAGAVILAANSNEGDDSGIIASKLYSDGSLVSILKTSGGVSLNQTAGFIEMIGKEVFKHAVDKMVKAVASSLESAGLNIGDVDLLIPHQANSRILIAVAERLGIDKDKVVMTVSEHANTSAASIPLALDAAIRQGRVKKGDIVVLEALGGGLTWGSIVMKW